MVWGIAVAVIASAVASDVHFHRFDGGPLSVDGASGGLARVGHPLSFPMLVSNDGDGSLTIERATPLYVAPGTRVRIWAVNTGKAGQAIGGPFPPEDTKPGDIRSVSGFVLTPSGPGTARFLLAEIERTGTAPRGKCVGIKGLAVEYKAGWRRYRRESRVLAFGRPPGVTDCQPELAEP